MSSVYATEPATAGRVILETTDGPLEIHLWSRECPQTTRFFLQLCLDGFYDNMVFHRIVNNFLIQTGALRHASAESVPSMSSSEVAVYRQETSASEALDRRSYEVNSRIRFNHRGQVAMALGVDDKADVEDLQPQFFISLEEAPFLDGKHVVFGSVTGPTIFNAVRVGRTETDEATHQPMDLPNATRIKNVKIVENPLHQGLTPHPNPPWRVKQKTSDATKPKKKKKRKGKFDTNVLSFGQEFEEEETMPRKTKKGIQSSHDVIQSKVLSKQVDKQVQGAIHDDSSEVPPEKQPSKKSRIEKTSESNTNTLSVEYSAPKERKARHSGVSDTQNASQSKKSNGNKEKAPKEKSSTPASKSSLVESRRLKYTKGKKSKKEREEETLNKLMAFRSTVQKTVEDRKSSAIGSSQASKQDDSLASRMARRAEKANGKGDSVEDSQAPTYRGQILDSDDDDTNGNKKAHGNRSEWLGTAFKCKRHVDHDSRDLGGDGRKTDDYELIDSKKGGRHRRDEKGRKHHRSSTRRHRD